MNIKTKTTLFTLWVVMCLTLSLMVVVYKAQENLRSWLGAENKDNLSLSIADELADQLLLPATVKKTLRKLNRHTDIMGACVFGPNNEFVSDYLNQKSQTLRSSSTNCFNFPSPLTTAYLSTIDLTLYNANISLNDKQLGRLILIVDQNKSIEEIRTELLKQAGPWVALIVLAVSLMFGLVFGLVLRRQFSPVSTLVKFTEKIISSKDYTSRFPTLANAELSKLGNNMNKIIGNLVQDINAKSEPANQLSSREHQMANFDSLTGLPNRQFIMEYLRTELERVKRDKSDLVVMFFDLDGFKNINDTLGHDVGDNILCAVAQRFKEQIRSGDTIARLGGDEFLLVPANNPKDEVVSLIAHKIVSAMQKPFNDNGLDLHLGVSIGIARASQANLEISELVSYADIAMYASKRAGKGQFTLFEENMIFTHKRKLTIANGIPRAVANDEFVVAYQPKVNKESVIIGFEALLRWTSPELGEVPTSEFIRVAERSGKIHGITLWVITHVFKDVTRLVERFGDNIKVSVNLSTLDLMQPKLIDFIQEQRSLHAINPKNLEFEITESSYLENFNDANRLFSELSKKGYWVSLDDFGTGFSSLGYLTQISIHTLKIDKKFVLNMNGNAKTLLVTRTIISLAKRLNLSVCAEGVENYSAFSTLARENCDAFQGYWFSEPLPIDRALELPLKLITYLPKFK